MLYIMNAVAPNGQQTTCIGSAADCVEYKAYHENLGHRTTEVMLFTREHLKEHGCGAGLLEALLREFKPGEV